MNDYYDNVKDNRLKPCPFCGEDAVFQYFDDFSLGRCLYVACSKCGIELNKVYSVRNIDIAIATWNKRSIT